MSTNADCASLRAALRDAGMGGPTSPALEAHLAGCASCRGELDALRGLSRAIDEELRATLALEPSPALLPRVRARVEAGGAGAGLFAPRWLGWAAAVLAVAGVAYLASRPGGSPQPSDGRRTARALPAAAPRSEATPRAEAQPSPPAPAPAARTLLPAERAVAQAAATPTIGPRPATPGSDELPVVLVAPDEERALALFVASLQGRRAEPGSLLAGGAEAGPLQDLNLGSISLEPLTITPLGRTE